MDLDIEFLQEYVAFLKNAFPANLDATRTVERTDIMVYALSAKLCSLIGKRLDFLDLASQGRPGGGGPHHDEGWEQQGRPGGGGPHYSIDQGRPGSGGPHRLNMLVSYATDVSTPALAEAFSNSQNAG
jgi:hypothetical protein